MGKKGPTINEKVEILEEQLLIQERQISTLITENERIKNLYNETSEDTRKLERVLNKVSTDILDLTNSTFSFRDSISQELNEFKIYTENMILEKINSVDYYSKIQCIELSNSKYNDDILELKLSEEKKLNVIDDMKKELLNKVEMTRKQFDMIVSELDKNSKERVEILDKSIRSINSKSNTRYKNLNDQLEKTQDIFKSDINETKKYFDENLENSQCESNKNIDMINSKVNALSTIMNKLKSETDHTVYELNKSLTDKLYILQERIDSNKVQSTKSINILSNNDQLLNEKLCLLENDIHSICSKTIQKSNDQNHELYSMIDRIISWITDGFDELKRENLNREEWIESLITWVREQLSNLKLENTSLSASSFNTFPQGTPIFAKSRNAKPVFAQESTSPVKSIKIFSPKRYCNSINKNVFKSSNYCLINNKNSNSSISSTNNLNNTETEQYILDFNNTTYKENIKNDQYTDRFRNMIHYLDKDNLFTTTNLEQIEITCKPNYLPSRNDLYSKNKNIFSNNYDDKNYNSISLNYMLRIFRNSMNIKSRVFRISKINLKTCRKLSFNWSNNIILESRNYNKQVLNKKFAFLIKRNNNLYNCYGIVRTQVNKLNLLIKPLETILARINKSDFSCTNNYNNFTVSKTSNSKTFAREHILPKQNLTTIYEKSLYYRDLFIYNKFVTNQNNIKILLNRTKVLYSHKILLLLKCTEYLKSTIISDYKQNSQTNFLNSKRKSKVQISNILNNEKFKQNNYVRQSNKSKHILGKKFHYSFRTKRFSLRTISKIKKYSNNFKLNYTTNLNKHRDTLNHNSAITKNKLNRSSLDKLRVLIDTLNYSDIKNSTSIFNNIYQDINCQDSTNFLRNRYNLDTNEIYDTDNVIDLELPYSNDTKQSNDICDNIKMNINPNYISQKLIENTYSDNKLYKYNQVIRTNDSSTRNEDKYSEFRDQTSSIETTKINQFTLGNNYTFASRNNSHIIIKRHKSLKDIKLVPFNRNDQDNRISKASKCIEMRLNNHEHNLLHESNSTPLSDMANYHIQPMKSIHLGSTSIEIFLVLVEGKNGVTYSWLSLASEINTVNLNLRFVVSMDGKKSHVLQLSSQA